MNFLIRNGTLVNADHKAKMDIRSAGSRIVEMGRELNKRENEELIDATDCLVLPGAIDPHVHMQLPTPSGISSDDFHSGSRAALYGGTTTLIDFVTPEKGQSLAEAIKLRKEEARSSLIDYSFHLSPVEWREGMSDEILHGVQSEGLRSFKAYMAYKSTIGLDDDDLFKVMQAISNAKGILAIHSEMGDDIDRLREQFAKEGKLTPGYHALSRPASCETEAVRRVVSMVEKTNCPVYIVHVSAASTLQVIKRARDQGLPVFAETCPHYLLLDDAKYDQEIEESVKFIMSPPLRKKEDNKALWDALSSGVIQTVGTDHCPFLLEQKMKNADDFRKIPNGAGGAEHRLALLYTFGVLKNRISPEQWVALVSTNPAKIFGLFPQKGTISPGADADVVVWDPEKRSTISAKTHHQNCDFNIYEGIPVMGQAKYVLAGGELLIDEFKLQNPTHRGRFLKTNSF